jgi:CheY-like chemotaxis protein
MSLNLDKAPRLPRLLVVDDVADNLFLMDGLLGEHFRVVQASSGKAALEVVMSNDPPELVLLDIMMPDMDGYEVLRRIRQHPPTADIPVIFVTALASQQDERLGLDLGALDYLTKPIDPELVLQRVDAHVRARAKAKRVEQLSEKLSRHLLAVQWQHLFQGPGYDSIGFEEKQQTVLYAEAPAMDVLSPSDRRKLAAEVQMIAEQHHGRIDRFTDSAALAFFDDPGACVRTAMELQRSATKLRLRIGVYTGTCVVATFRNGQQWHRALVGPQVEQAAKVAATAASGSIAVSPDTYALVKADIAADAGGCLLMEEFHDSDLAQVCLTPAPAPAFKQSEYGLSTFAGLGRL